MHEVIAVSSLAAQVGVGESRAMHGQDPFVALLAELRRLAPHGKVSEAAREIGISVSHLHGILRGSSDASGEVRAKIARYVARRGGTVTGISELGLDAEPQPAQTATQPVVGPSESRGLEVLVPTPYHAALCDLITTLPVPAVLKLIPQVVQLAEQEYQKLPQPPAPADDTK
jgi:hypothetical protein